MSSYRYQIEYIWLDAHKNYRSKTRILSGELPTLRLDKVPLWNYDGSSTGQMPTSNSELILQPVFICNNPLLKSINSSILNYLVLCDTYVPDEMSPTDSNSRYSANNIFNSKPELKPWFGLEQEYFITSISSSFPDDSKQNDFYCGTGYQNQVNGRTLANRHLKACLKAELSISGINAEVAPGQWEFQIGPVEGIQAADQLHIARYMLERIAEKMKLTISFAPKPYKQWNGSGCHTNFSTEETRCDNGIDKIHEYVKHLSNNHLHHMKNYGDGNVERMTGDCETSSFSQFSLGLGARDVSVRIGNDTLLNKKGYFEDRRPASNCDPYIVTSLIFKTCCLEDFANNIESSPKSPLQI